MDGQIRNNIKPGILVDVVLKKDQPTGKLTRGHVKRILTNSSTHPHGIKVMLVEQNLVGRVQKILSQE
ncbi:MAG: YwbE family protein [Acholeplasmataceae bacterium]|nr:YwbE family protein [Acholeplasmataceae bacterium]